MPPVHAVPDRADPSSLFDELVAKHYAGLCNFAFRFVSSREIAEDIVQDVLAELWCRWPEFDVREPLPYLCQAVRNRVANHRRHEKVRVGGWDRIAAEAERRTAAVDASREVEATDLEAAIVRAVDDLPERCRLIFTMSRAQDLTYTQIAQALGLSVKTVENQMTRALRTLRTRLAGYLGAVAAAISLCR